MAMSVYFYIFNYIEEKKVTISPGVTTGELGFVFLQQGVNDGTRCCFLSDVVLGTVTYGGVVSTGCHVSKLHSLLCIVKSICTIML